jgi:Transposase IS116/IS110/IS902 family
MVQWHPRNLKRKCLDLENAIRHSLKAFGIRLKGCGRGGFAQTVHEAVAGDALASELIDAMLNARAALWKEYCRLHHLVVKLVASQELCRRFMQIPGVGPAAALSFVTAIHDPAGFRRSRDVAAYFGLTSRGWQSGSSIDVQGRISKASRLIRLIHRQLSSRTARYRISSFPGAELINRVEDCLPNFHESGSRLQRSPVSQCSDAHYSAITFRNFLDRQIFPVIHWPGSDHAKHQRAIHDPERARKRCSSRIVA